MCVTLILSMSVMQINFTKANIKTRSYLTLISFEVYGEMCSHQKKDEEY